MHSKSVYLLPTELQNIGDVWQPETADPTNSLLFIDDNVPHLAQTRLGLVDAPVNNFDKILFYAITFILILTPNSRHTAN